MNLESKARINSLISAANATTGKADTDLTSAVGALIAGFRQGGGGSTSNLLKEVVEGTITELVDENITTVGFRGLQDKTALRKVSLPNCLSLGNSAFSGCTALTEVYLPKCESAVSYAFTNTGLEYLSLPGLTGWVNSSITNNKKLKVVDLVAPHSISTNGFNGSSVLDTLILRKNDSIVPLANVGAFNKTPFASGGTGGTVYVPQALIESYQTATNWSTLYTAGTCNFVAIEGSEYE